MEARLVAQPYADGFSLYDFLGKVAGDPCLDNLMVVVAWARRSGLSRIGKYLEDMRTRRCKTRLIVGIGEGGATTQGLKLARQLFDIVHVFHEEVGSTFHPKLYFAWGDDSARFMVGSHNLTGGGVFGNFEVGLDCQLTPLEDLPLINSIHGYLNRLYTDIDVCHELTEEFLDLLMNNAGRYRIEDEDLFRPMKEVSDQTRGGLPDSLAETTALFGRSRERRKPDPGSVPPASTSMRIAGREICLSDFSCPQSIRMNVPGASWAFREWDPRADGVLLESLLSRLDERQLVVIAAFVAAGPVGLTTAGLKALGIDYLPSTLSAISGKFRGVGRRPVWNWDRRCYWVPDGPVRSFFWQAIAERWPGLFR